jgi:hypothetical protein
MSINPFGLGAFSVRAPFITLYSSSVARLSKCCRALCYQRRAEKFTLISDGEIVL